MTDRGAVNLAHLIAEADLCVLSGTNRLDTPVGGAIICDLLSHVMAHAKAGDVWVTLQTHANVIAVAALAQIAAIVLIDGYLPDADTVARADEEGVVLLSTHQSAFEVGGRLYMMGVR